MSETPDFLKAIRRMQAQIDHLIHQGDYETMSDFNKYLEEIKHFWIVQEQVSEELRGRIAALSPLEIRKKQVKYAGLRRFSIFGSIAADQFARDDLNKELIQIRNQLASIEFIYKMEA